MTRCRDSRLQLPGAPRSGIICLVKDEGAGLDEILASE